MLLKRCSCIPKHFNPAIVKNVVHNGDATVELAGFYSQGEYSVTNFCSIMHKFLKRLPSCHIYICYLMVHWARVQTANNGDAAMSNFEVEIFILAFVKGVMLISM